MGGWIKKKKGKKKIITVKLNVYGFLLFSPWFCRLFFKSELPITDQLLMRSTSIFDFKLENMTSPGNFSHTVCYYISRFSPIILKCHEWHENMCRSGSIVLITGCDNLLRVPASLRNIGFYISKCQFNWQRSYTNFRRSQAILVTFWMRSSTKRLF